MGWKKRDLVKAAFRKAGLASYLLNLKPEQYQAAMQDMDAMIASWAANGIYVGYLLPSTPDGGDLDEDSGVVASNTEAVYMNLALRIAGDFGKTVSPNVSAAASQSLDRLMSSTSTPLAVPVRGGMPLGAGNKGMGWWRRTFTQTPDLSSVVIGSNGDIDLKE